MSTAKQPVTAIIIGAGGRGMGYAQFAQVHPERLRIVGVAEPREWYRNEMKRLYDIAEENIFTDWAQATNRHKFADAVIICTQDSMHADPAVAFSDLGYAILLEKPMAPTMVECERIIDAVHRNHSLFAVAHVMRYTRYTQMLKSIVDAGEIGDIVSLQHLEPVGYWHQAHSFVRGHWRNESQSSSMLLAKSCHDLDWIRYILATECLSVSSFGSLIHFQKSEKPAKAKNALRCLDCDYEPECPYSAKKIYISRVKEGNLGWPVNVLTPDPSEDSILEALKHGPYGRCVYECDNTVVDHQVVNMWFKGGKSAVFTMTAFTKADHRKTRLFGTRGEIYGDGNTIEIFDFLTDQTRKIDTNAADSSVLGGHGGGDYGLMDHFVSAVSQNNPDLILSGPDESLETHRMVFASEQSRHEHRIVDLASH
jgi:predicted dehydrogenase